jgi:hypothetical protein
MARQEYYDGTQWVLNGDGTVKSITAGTGLDGGTITDTGTISVADTAVTAGNYEYASITVNQQGQITSATNGAAPVTVINGTPNQVNVVTDANGSTISLSSTIECPGDIAISNGQLTIPVGTTAERPADPVIGMVRINTDLN